jgi:hypothetical protein
MDWSTIFAAGTTALVGIPAAVYGAVRYIRRTESSDKAERYANDWHQKVIERQDREAERLRAEIAALRESATMVNKRVLELELETKTARKVTRDLVEQVRLVKRDRLDPHDLQTNVFTDSGGHLR